MTFTDENAHFVCHVANSIKTSDLARAVLSVVAVAQESDSPIAPIHYIENDLISIFREKSKVREIGLFKGEVERDVPAAIKSYLEFSNKNRDSSSEAAEAIICIRPDLDEWETNFAIVKECSHILIRHAMLASDESMVHHWPGNVGMLLDLLNGLAKRNVLSSPREPDGLKPVESALWRLERKATRLAIRILCPKIYYDVLLNYMQEIDNEGQLIRRAELNNFNLKQLRLPQSIFDGIIDKVYDLSVDV